MGAGVGDFTRGHNRFDERTITSHYTLRGRHSKTSLAHVSVPRRVTRWRRPSRERTRQTPLLREAINHSKQSRTGCTERFSARGFRFPWNFGLLRELEPRKNMEIVTHDVRKLKKFSSCALLKLNRMKKKYSIFKEDF